MKEGLWALVATFAAVALLQAEPSVAQPAPPADWFSTLDVDGWQVDFHAAKSAFFFQIDRPHHRLWLRAELWHPLVMPPTAFGPVYRSATAAYEIDCAGGRYRVLQETRYPGQNLDGPSWKWGPQPGDWEVDPPSSTMSRYIILVCSPSAHP